MNVAINGFGRIGRSVFKAILGKKGFKVVAINDLADTKILAHLLQYDSCYGIYGKKVGWEAGSLLVDKKKYHVLAEKDPLKLPWEKLKVDIVLECSGRFSDAQSAGQHLSAGAKKVLISAPAKDASVKTIVLSVNEKDLNKNDKIISMASCTTNCLAPVTKIISDNFGIQKAVMSTIHSYTADQNLVDGQHRDLRRARAAAVNIIPTTTGAAKAAVLAMPEIGGKFDGLSFRVPAPIVSLCDAVYLTQKVATVEQVNQVLKKAAAGDYKKYLAVTEEQLVSSDFIGNQASAIVDLPLTKVIDGDMVKIISWYDNECGYGNRLSDLCEYIADKKFI